MEKKRSRSVLWATAAVLFGVLFVFNRLAPLIADDYSYCQSWADWSQISSPLQIPASMAAHYFDHGGRILVHGIGQLLLLLPGWLFDLLNAGVFVGFSCILYSFGFRRKEYSPLAYALLAVGMWLYIPEFAQTSLWLIGSANYLWGTAISMGWLLCFWRLAERDAPAGPARTAGMTAGAFLAGFCNENTSAAVLLAAGLLMLILLLERRRWRLWMITSCASGFVGWVIMVMAPGNDARAAREGVNSSLSLDVLYARFVNCTNVLQDTMQEMLLACGVLFVLALALRVSRGVLLRGAALLVSGLACTYAMMGAPYLSARSMMGTFGLLAAACMVLLRPVLHTGVRAAAAAAVGAGAVVCAFSVILSGNRCLQDRMLWQQRQTEVMAQAAQGVSDITTFSIASTDRYSVFSTLVDLTDDPDHWANNGYRQFYGIGSVTATEARYSA